MSRHRSILCVDADGFGLQVRRLVLETSGHRVSAFTRSDEALRALTSQQADVVMLDHSLENLHPGTARAFKKLRPETPILMLSNQVYPPASAIPFIDGFITKGEAPQRLLAELENIVSRRARTQHPMRPLFWAGGAVATAAAWFGAKALRRRMHRGTARDQLRKTTLPAEPQSDARAARA